MRATYGLSLSSATLEGIDDFDGLYVQQILQTMHGLVPYRDFAISYPPLFLYTLYPFYLLGGASLASIPIFLADAATVPVLYLVVRQTADERLALLAGLAYAFSPFALYYEGYAWFSSQPMTFFAILGAYYLARDKPIHSLSALAVAILFKQEVIFLLPVFLVCQLRRDSWKLLVGISSFGAILTIVSLPFLVISARDYLALVSYGILGRWSGSAISEPVTNTAICQAVYTNLVGTGMSCALGSVTYSQFVTNAAPLAVLLDRISYGLNMLSGLLAIPLLLLLIPVLFSLRKHPQFIPLISTYSGVGFLILFSLVYHLAFKYYYVPVYALLFTVVVNRQSLAAAVTAATLSVVTPSGAFQEFLPLLAILVIAIILDRNASGRGVPQALWKTSMNQSASSWYPPQTVGKSTLESVDAPNLAIRFAMKIRRPRIRMTK